MRIAAATVAAAVVPDLAQLLPLLAASFSDPRGLSVLAAYATALPGREPALSPTVALLSHHLHCALHSAVVAGLATLAVAVLARSLWLPLLGWWSHIVIDVFTHSADYYPVPVLYPFTQRGFDGLAWNTPWFLALNYAAIVIAFVLLWIRRHAGGRPVDVGQR
jgi:hypothetical protein